jgi:hypothetical protein
MLELIKKNMPFSSLLKRLGLKLSLNDPRWGNDKDNNKAQEGKKPDGPPDLDQLWRDFNQRLNGLFGNKRNGNNNGGGGSSGGGDMKVQAPPSARWPLSACSYGSPPAPSSCRKARAAL